MTFEQANGLADQLNEYGVLPFAGIDDCEQLSEAMLDSKTHGPIEGSSSLSHWAVTFQVVGIGKYEHKTWIAYKTGHEG